ncbi:polynucleotide 5'-hydroxyl-kinase NOL9 [Anopheles nili]|uniref:polynucleotide 5'-hydroxyl-kinase NOL9 n=1 Tax=Anopheles nili TaxID=185578 RepID=UPI00237C41D3|nr:polynucleotide 5'-hydroxyl-kinase NOL9 [Anopheles nili]
MVASSAKSSQPSTTHAGDGPSNGYKDETVQAPKDMSPANGNKAPVVQGAKDNLKEPLQTSQANGENGNHSNTDSMQPSNENSPAPESHPRNAQTASKLKNPLKSDSPSDSDDSDYIDQFFDDEPELNVEKRLKPAPNKVKAKVSPPKKNETGWKVENSDCQLKYETESDISDDEPPSMCVAKKRKAPSFVQETTEHQLVALKRKRASPSSDDEASDESYDEFYDESYDESSDESYDSENDLDLLDEDTDDEDWTESDEYDSEFDDFDDEIDGEMHFSINDVVESDDEDYRNYMSGQPYDSEETDDDFTPMKEHVPTLFVPPGAASIYDLNDESIKFDNSLRIIELSADYGAEKDSVKPPEPVADEAAESDGSCPMLVDARPKEAPKIKAHRFFNSLVQRKALGLLRAPIYVIGHVSVQVLFGKVEIMGYQLQQLESKDIYASSGYNAINLSPQPIQAGFSREIFERILTKLKPNYLEADIQLLKETYDPATDVLVFLDATLNAYGSVPAVCNIMPELELFPIPATLNPNAQFHLTEHLLEIAFVVPGPSVPRNVSLFQHNPAWDTMQLEPSTRLMIMGGKGSGKSTLCQYLINRHVKQFGRIVLIDLDIGQPLLHLPETVSVSVLTKPILGVGCFATIEPVKCLLFGSLNVVSSPVVYVQNVRTLLEYCNADPTIAQVPWIVNTMGYVVGFGEELTAVLVRLFQPTDLIQLTLPSGHRKSQNYTNQLTASVINGFKFNILKEEIDHQQTPLQYRFHPMDVMFEQRTSSLLPPKRRNISIMAQLVKILGEEAESFTDVKPHSASLDDLKILITRDEYVPSKKIQQYLLNATLVYLCELLSNGQFDCFGVGIVRAVDLNRTVHLLHALTPEQLAKVNVLSLCNTSLPSHVYLHQSPSIEGTVPYLHIVEPSPPTPDV